MRDVSCGDWLLERVGDWGAGTVLTEHLAAATTAPADLVAGFWSGWGELSGYGAVRYAEGRTGLRG